MQDYILVILRSTDLISVGRLSFCRTLPELLSWKWKKNNVKTCIQTGNPARASTRFVLMLGQFPMEPSSGRRALTSTLMLLWDLELDGLA